MKAARAAAVAMASFLVVVVRPSGPHVDGSPARNTDGRSGASSAPARDHETAR